MTEDANSCMQFLKFEEEVLFWLDRKTVEFHCGFIENPFFENLLSDKNTGKQV